MGADVDADTLAAESRQFVRNVRAPHRLQDNHLARALLERAGSPKKDPAVLADALDDALAHLRPRDRAIVQRCEIDRDVFAVVARELRISERHLYRERQRILKDLARILLQSASVIETPRSETLGALARLVRTSRTLEENGSLSAATEIIEKQALACSAPVDRARLLLRLAELHARSGSFSRAMECLSISVEHGKQHRESAMPLESELALTRATIAHQCGRPIQGVLKDLRNVTDLIEAAGTLQFDTTAATIFSRALALRVEAAVFAGDLGQAAAACKELNAALCFLRDPDAETQVEVLSAQSLSKIFCEADLEAAINYRWQAIDVAENAGLTLSSIALAVNLASSYRLRGESERVVSMLSARLDTARAIANGPVLAALLIELAGAFMDCRLFDRARATLDEAVVLVENHEGLRAAYLRQRASLNLRMREFEQSYEHAAAAEQGYFEIGKQRLAASSRRLQAEALYSTGQRRGALRRIHSAIDALAALDQRQSLARAYEVLWKISRDFRHLELARQLAVFPIVSAPKPSASDHP